MIQYHSYWQKWKWDWVLPYFEKPYGNLIFSCLTLTDTKKLGQNVLQKSWFWYSDSWHEYNSCAGTTTCIDMIILYFSYKQMSYKWQYY